MNSLIRYAWHYTLVGCALFWLAVIFVLVIQ